MSFALRLLVGIAIGVVLYVIGAGMISRFKAPAPPEPDPDDVKPVNLKFRCVVCGAEVVMTAAQEEEPEAPRHCREDMEPVDA